MSLEGKIAVVTGAAQGIGKVYAQALATAGASVVCADINLALAEQTAGEISTKGGHALGMTVDVSDPESAQQLASVIKTELGGADILVNNAAIYAGMEMDPQMTVDVGYWRKVMSVNLDGALVMTQAIAPMMLEKGWGRVVNQTSNGAYSGHGGIYAVSKLAMIGLTQGFARELGGQGVTVNAIAPGIIYTEATKSVVPIEMQEHIRMMTPITKDALPEDLVGTLLFLVSDGAEWMTGQTLVVDGGLTPRI